ncbi:protein translocase subunit SecD [Moheibacter lacus]|uniref:Multifunctional fusion protein n=1 Tax=Moheibacter lacus TaxID=2745851 RepID=A0A838ZKU7_9FLAO|nr:protein translocase subunit SecD [Moheibacter lacus]MBA5628310.1 protein translocase subunit SecD [Moheibacter lacus]
MKGKWLIAGIAIILGILSIRQLSYTWYTNKVECEAYENSTDEAHEQIVLDSLANDTLDLGIISYNYRDAKNKEMKLGLDLRGGISVILQVQVRDLLEDLADHSENPIFVEALNSADIKQRSQGNRAYVDIFFDEFERIRSEKGQQNLKYASADLFGNRQNASFIEFNETDESIKEKIKDDIDAKIGTAYQVISSRINRFGVVEPVIQRLGGAGDGRILVEMPGEKNKERIKNLLQSTAKLEFWKVEANNPQVTSYFSSVNPQSLGVKTDAQSLAGIIQPALEGNSMFSVATKDTAVINGILNSENLKANMPSSIRNFKYFWGQKPVQTKDANTNGKFLSLYALSGDAQNAPLLLGDVIDQASGERNSGSISNEPIVSMKMNAEGAQKWGRITEENVGNSIAIVLDNTVYSAPNINEPIKGGSSQISGNFTLDEARDLANILQAGSLPASSKIVQLEEVGPSLGQEAINSSLIAFVAVFVLILFWMVFYYSRAGIYADIAVTVNTLFLLGLMVGLFGATLSLPGIAGIILTLAIAIDANIIINERVKDEMLHHGKSLKESISIAYSWKGAISAIFDSHLTSIITAAILLIFGKGPVQGFAITLLIGLFCSLFTAIFLTKLFIDRRLDQGKDVAFFTSITKNWFQGMNIDFMAKRKMFYIISIVVSIACLAIIAVRGFDMGVDFEGGRTYTIRFEQPVSANDVRVNLEKTLTDDDGTTTAPTVKIFGPSNQVKVTTKLKADQESTAIDNEIKQKIYEGVKSFLPANYTYEQFSKDDTAIGIMSVVKVGPTIADDTTRASILAVILALIGVGVYILFRFKWQFGVGIVAGALHDVIVILGLFAALHGILPFNLEIDQAFIAAILTVIGYSINDSVIIFDRIREYMGMYPKMPFDELINKSTNNTLSRTMNTSISMILVVLIIFIFGGETIKGFMFAMLIGVIVGTYSSIYISSQVMYDLTKNKIKKSN